MSLAVFPLPVSASRASSLIETSSGADDSTARLRCFRTVDAMVTVLLSASVSALSARCPRSVGRQRFVRRLADSSLYIRARVLFLPRADALAPRVGGVASSGRSNGRRASAGDGRRARANGGSRRLLKRGHLSATLGACSAVCRTAPSRAFVHAHLTNLLRISAPRTGSFSCRLLGMRTNGCPASLGRVIYAYGRGFSRWRDSNISLFFLSDGSRRDE